MLRFLWLSENHVAVFTATALLTHTPCCLGAEKHIKTHWQSHGQHKHYSMTAYKGSQGGQGNADRTGIEVGAEKLFPFVRFPPASKKEELLIYKSVHTSCTKDAQLDHWLLHIMSKALNFGCLLSTKRSNKN